MTTDGGFDREKAVARFTGLARLIRVGAYQERDSNGNYAEDGIEEELDTLLDQAACCGLEFQWHSNGEYWTLEPMSEEARVAYQQAKQRRSSHG